MLRVGTALLTFAVGVGCALLWLVDRGPGRLKTEAPCAEAAAAPEVELPEVPFCTLMSNVDEYEGQKVRARAVIRFGIHGATIGDASCPSSGEENLTYVSTSPPAWEEIRRLTADAYGAKYSRVPLEVVAVGRLRRNHPTHSSDTWADRAGLRFDLERVESGTRPR
jgi:hypothetical protein